MKLVFFLSQTGLIVLHKSFIWKLWTILSNGVQFAPSPSSVTPTRVKTRSIRFISEVENSWGRGLSGALSKTFHKDEEKINLLNVVGVKDADGRNTFWEERRLILTVGILLSSVAIGLNIWRDCTSIEWIACPMFSQYLIKIEDSYKQIFATH
jgi:hypothetical protein